MTPPEAPAVQKVEGLRVKLRNIICETAIGIRYDSLFANKAEWVAFHGERDGHFRDVNDPFKADVDDAVDAILSLAKADAILGVEASAQARLIAYEDAHATAVEMGYPSLTEALEALADLRETVCETCKGTGRLHVIAGTTTPAYDMACPTCAAAPALPTVEGGSSGGRVQAAPSGATEDQHSAGWFPALLRPNPGHKLVAVFNDGSGAQLFYAHDGGYIGAEGDERDDLDAFSCWAYLPQGLKFWCELTETDAYTLPFHPADCCASSPSEASAGTPATDAPSLPDTSCKSEGE
jgi:hypothetical protein